MVNKNRPVSGSDINYKYPIKKLFRLNDIDEAAIPYLARVTALQIDARRPNVRTGESSAC